MSGAVSTREAFARCFQEPEVPERTQNRTAVQKQEKKKEKKSKVKNARLPVPGRFKALMLI